MFTSFITDTANRKLSHRVDFTLLGVNFQSGDNFRINVTPQAERLDNDFGLPGDIELAEGSEFDYTRFRISGGHRRPPNGFPVWKLRLGQLLLRNSARHQRQPDGPSKGWRPPQLQRPVEQDRTTRRPGLDHRLPLGSRHPVQPLALAEQQHSVRQPEPRNRLAVSTPGGS